MKTIVLFLLIQYSIYLNCFFSNFSINFFCKNIATFERGDYIIFYCKEKDGVDIYKYNVKTKKNNFFGHIKGGQNTLYFIDFAENTEISIKVTNKFIKISAYVLRINKRNFQYSKILKNKSSIYEYTEDILLDVNCDGYKDIVIPYSNFYKIYLATKKYANIKFRFFKRLYFGFIETRRKESFYDNVWFKIGYSLPKIYSFKYKSLCFNLVHYISAGIINVYKNNFKKKVAKIVTAKNKDKYEEFIVYPRPELFIHCNSTCNVVHFEHKRGILYITPLYYPYNSVQIQFVKGSILNFTYISKNMFWVLYLPKLNFFDFYELLMKNILDIKLALVREQNKVFNIVYEFPLTTKINLKEDESFITIDVGSFVCAKEVGSNLEIIFSEKDAVYKYTLDLLSNVKKVKEIEKLKTENPIPIIEKYKCLNNMNSLIVFSPHGKINYLEKK